MDDRCTLEGFALAVGPLADSGGMASPVLVESIKELRLKHMNTTHVSGGLDIEGLCEIVAGRRVELPPLGALESWIAGRLFVARFRVPLTRLFAGCNE